MANAGCINAIGFDGSLIRTLQNLDSSNIGVGVQFTAPNPLDDKRLDYIKYTDKCGNTCCLSGENEILIYATQGVIKNLTLTNDDTNEVVNVKRTDLFGSNRKKTVVRYKTGGYPTSITDGTLAVEELVQNQYSSTGYNVSGLSDGTTYYFSAFAVAQDDTIIDMQSKNITTDFYRKPNANTMIYIPMNSDFSDHSSNAVSVANTNVSLNTSVLSGKGVGYFSSYSHLNYVLDNMKHDYTIMFRMKSSETTSTKTRVFYSIGTSKPIRRGGNSTKINRSDGINADITASGVNVFDMQRHLVSVVYKYSTNTLYIYSDGVLRKSGTSQPYTNNAEAQAIGYFVYPSGASSSEYYYRGYASELIVEQKERTQAELTRYFNKMKSKYGIS